MTHILPFSRLATSVAIVAASTLAACRSGGHHHALGDPAAPSILVLGSQGCCSSKTSVNTSQHGDHGQAKPEAQKAAADFKGDPYLLATDPVSDTKLGPIEKQVVFYYEGRELRFASQANADKFKADPAKYLASVDKALVEQQKPFYPLETCLVSGEKLDPNAGAIDLVWANRLIRLSKKDHEKAFLADPAKFVAKLDAAVIEQQKPAYKLATCVVSGEKLGGEMGDPIDYVVGNRLVRFCCKSCLKDFGKDPLKYLGQLDGGGKPNAGAKGSSEKSVSYSCPMHPDVLQDSPGRCPKCGMDLVKKK